MTMTAVSREAGQFGQRMREFFVKHAQVCRTLRVERHGHVYTSGQQDAMVYFIDKGLVKLMLSSPEGKECLLAVRTPGDIFGELSLSGQLSRLETAIAVQDLVLKQISYRSFLMGLKQESLLESLVQYLAFRVAEQQEVIADLTTANSEQRLARALLHLAQEYGSNDTCGIRLGLRLSQEDLSAMVGTTRTRIGIFLKKFRQLGLIRLNEERCLVIEESKLQHYLLQNPPDNQIGTGIISERNSRDTGPLRLAPESPGI